MTTPLEKDWYFREWMAHLGKRQADAVRGLGWAKGRVSKFYNGEHDYRREIVNVIADWMGIEPYELLMPPSEAMALRRLRETALAIAAQANADLDELTPATRARRAGEGS